MTDWRELMTHLKEGPWIAVIAAALVRRVFGYDVTMRDMAETVIAGLFCVLLIAPGLAEWLQLGREASASLGAVLGLVARSVVHALLRLGQMWRDNPTALSDWWRGKK